MISTSVSECVQGFILDKKMGVGQKKRMEDAKVGALIPFSLYMLDLADLHRSNVFHIRACVVSFSCIFLLL